MGWDDSAIDLGNLDSAQLSALSNCYRAEGGCFREEKHTPPPATGGEMHGVAAEGMFGCEEAPRQATNLRRSTFLQTPIHTMLLHVTMTEPDVI